MRRQRIGRTVLAAIPILFCAACGGESAEPGESNASDTPEIGGTAVVGFLSDFQTFNPVINTAANSGDVMRYMLFTPLIELDSELEPRPYLAESWELSDTAVTFRLRDDVRWHDGRPVTAEDVKFTFDLAKDPQSASLLGAAYLTMITSAEVLDSRTIHFRFAEPHSEPLEAFRWPPLPKHLLEGSTAADLAQAPFNGQPVGSGPFRFVSWNRGESLTLEANPDFPEALGGRPNLDRIVFRIVPEPTTLLTELLVGSIDLTGVPAAQAKDVEGRPNVELRTAPSTAFTYIGWNGERPPFDDARTRRAMVMGIDRKGLIDAFLYGYGELVDGTIPSWHRMYTELPPLPYDPEAAKRLLAEVGWRDTNGDGVLEKDGRPFEFNLLVNSASNIAQDFATAIHQQLQQIGVTVNIQLVEFQTMIRQHRTREYDAALASWVLDTFRVDPTSLFSCAEARRPQSVNRAGYCNVTADQLMSQGLRTGDPANGKGIWGEYSLVLQQDQPVSFLYWSESVVGVSSRLRNVEIDVRGTLVNARDWWIPVSQQR